MSWNYRLVNEEGFVSVKEVYYDEAGTPCMYGKATVGTDEGDEVRAVLLSELKRFKEAIDKPILHVETDFDFGDK